MTACPECLSWQEGHGEFAHCFDCAVEIVEAWVGEKYLASLPKVKEPSKRKPIAYQPVKRAVKPRKR